MDSSPPDEITLTRDHPALTVTGVNECPSCGGRALWRAMITREALGLVHYRASCASCGDVTEHSIDLLAGMAKPYDRGI